MKKIKKEDFVLLFFIFLFVFFVGFLIFKEANNNVYSLNRNEVFSFFPEKINEIAPEKPVLGGKWQVARFRFVDNNSVYVEYEDGHIARAFLLTLNKNVGSMPDYKIVGYFSPGPLGFDLLSGEDISKDKPQEIYEYNETAKKWLKVN